MMIRDRILDFRRVPASQLCPHPRNWRLHPPAQQSAVRTLLERVGYAQALLARELEDGRLELIDGHLRAELTPDEIVPVLVLDVNAQESLELLATINPLASLAETDETAWASLAAELTGELPQLEEWLGSTPVERSDETQPRRRESSPADLQPASVAGCSHDDAGALFQVIVNCESEGEQRSVFEQLRTQGLTCRLLIL